MASDGDEVLSFTIIFWDLGDDTFAARGYDIYSCSGRYKGEWLRAYLDAPDELREDPLLKPMLKDKFTEWAALLGEVENNDEVSQGA